MNGREKMKGYRSQQVAGLISLKEREVYYGKA